MQKTVVVTVERQVIHPLYKRVVRRSKRFLAHDEKNECRVGDTVRIQETRPLSRRKRWRVAEILTKAALVAPVPEVDV
jgi:small subunit ribosomal protein S17